MVDGRNRVLPELGGRHVRSEAAGVRAHVAVRELIPGLGEGVGELGRIIEPALGDLGISRIHLQGDVGREHHRRVALRLVVRVRHGVLRGAALGRPLMGAGGGLGEFPFVAPEVLEVFVRPAGGRAGPGAFKAAGDRVDSVALAEGVLPAEAHLFERGAFGFRTDVADGSGGAVGLAEGVTTGDERDGLFVVHRHAREGVADVAGGSERVGLAVGAFGVDVDQAHLDRAERVGELAVAGVALVAEPFGLRAPVDVFLRFPDVRTAAGEAEGLEAHALEGDVAGEDHEVGPGDLLAILLLEGPEEAAGLVEVGVVWPAVERGEAQRAVTGAATAVGDAVGAGAMPGHADEEGAVMTVVGRPPFLRIGHQRSEVLAQGFEVELLELLGVIETRSERIALRGVLTEDVKVELIWPPVAVVHRGGGGMAVLRGQVAHHGAFGDVGHMR